jgi:hypothetical protein
MDSDTGKPTPALYKYVVSMMVTASLLGATLLSMCAAISTNSYDCAMSSGICGVAFVHYLAIMNIRKGQWERTTKRAANTVGSKNEDEDEDGDYLCAMFRHSDWSVSRDVCSCLFLCIVILKILSGYVRTCMTHDAGDSSTVVHEAFEHRSQWS